MARFVFRSDLSKGVFGEHELRLFNRCLDSIEHVGIGALMHGSTMYGSDQAQSILAPVVIRMTHRIRLSHRTGTRVVRCEPISPPGMEPIKRYPTRDVSTFPRRKCRRLVTPVRMTACAMSVPTITFGG